MRLSDRISKKYIDAAEKAGACEDALEWLREAPRTWRQLKEERPDWLLFGCKINIPYPSEWIDECAEKDPWTALVYASKHLTPERLDWCAEKKPRAALMYASKHLTPERLDRCAEKHPWAALAYATRYLTLERFDWCVKEDPQAALTYAAGLLTPKRKKWCRRKIRRA